MTSYVVFFTVNLQTTSITRTVIQYRHSVCLNVYPYSFNSCACIADFKLFHSSSVSSLIECCLTYAKTMFDIKLIMIANTKLMGNYVYSLQAITVPPNSRQLSWTGHYITFLCIQRDVKVT